jgi:hypothetical protein
MEIRMAKEGKQELINTNVFVLGQTTFVPHYTKSGVYVGPGYGKYSESEYSAKELVVAGALMAEKPLWKRSWAVK